MTRTDWLGMGLLLSLAAALVIAFFLYLRTAYREGGWKNVKTSALIAVGTLIVFYVVRVAENSDLEILKEAVNRVTR
jgi:hypothetical protein